MTPTTAIGSNELKLSFTSPSAMESESLAAHVIDGCVKFKTLLPYVYELRERFKSLRRGGAHIAGCTTWKQFCEEKLDRTTQGVGKALQAFEDVKTGTPKQKKDVPPIPQITDAEFIVWADAHPNDIRKITKNLAERSYLTHADITDALVNMKKFPRPYAEAAVRVCLPPAPEEPVEPEPTPEPPTKPPVKPGSEAMIHAKKPQSKNPELVAAIQAHEKAAKDLTASLKQKGVDGEVSRSKTNGKFHLVLRDLTTDQIHAVGQAL